MPIRAALSTTDGARTVTDPRKIRDSSGTTWVRVQNATEDDVEFLEEVFGVHTLATDDTVTNVRATTQEFDEYTFVLLKSARLAPGDTTFAEEITDTPVGIFIGADWLITLSPEETDPVAHAWESLVENNGQLLQRGPDFVAYLIVDTIVNNYFTILDGIESQIEHVEDSVVTELDIDILESINNVRRELLAVRKILIPAREAVGFLARGESSHVRDDVEKYYRNVYDHLVQIVELTETYRELTTGARDIYLNSLSVSTNEVMKKLTVVATIILPLTFITGIYGMNFTGSPYNMPELTWRYGYPAALLLMAGVAVALGSYFDRKGWL